jgi:Cupin domain
MTTQEIKAKAKAALSASLRFVSRTSASLDQRLSNPSAGPLDKEKQMPRLVSKSLDTPEETREFKDGMGQLQLVEGVGRATFQPGWKWSEHVKPIAGTDSCQAAHAGYVISGRMHIVMDDGQEADFGPGDYMLCDPGHDAWIVGDEPCVVIDWQGFADYAKAHS